MTESTNEAQSPPPSRPPRRRGRKRSRGNAKNRPVPLHKRSRSHFQQGDRQRGARYFTEGRVSLVIDGNRAKARVNGTERQNYSVGFDWSRVAGERVLHAFCDCQRFAGGSPCKHLWATLLALAETGPENQPPGKDRLGLRKDRLQAWPDLGVAGDLQGQVPVPPARPRPRPTRRKRGGRGGNDHGTAISWRSQFGSIREDINALSNAAHTAALAPARPAMDIFFLINTTASLGTSGLVLDIFGRGRNNTGKPSKLKRVSVNLEEIDAMLLPKSSTESSVDSVAVVAALPIEQPNRQGRRGPVKAHPAKAQRLRLPQRLYDPVLSHLCAKGTLGWWDGRALRALQPLSWNTSPPWRLALHLEIATAGSARLRGGLEREGESLPLSAAELILPTGPAADGSSNGRAPNPVGLANLPAIPGQPAAITAGPALILLGDSIARLEVESQRDLPWLSLLRGADEILIPKEDLEEALTALLELPNLPRLEAPIELQLSEEKPTPQPHLVLEADPAPAWMNPPLLAELSFDYGTMQLSAGDPRSAVVDWQGQKFLRRDMESEHGALVRLLELGLQPVASSQGHGLELEPRALPSVVEPLLLDGWSVEVHGATMRPPSAPALRVESGIDWFELSGEVDFDGDMVELSKVLDSISRGDRFILLEDGSKGLLPEAWMQTYDSLSKLATSSSDAGLRFIPSQALLVDALLTAMPPAVDTAFSKLRDKLLSFDRIKPKKEPRGFDGTLRSYQRDGLGWLNFLREFGLGGVLADDMGLGKTVQVLALLRANRTPSKTTGLPYLVVAPRSVVYNWLDEAARFTPKLKVVEYSGADREAIRAKLNDYDVVVTTYGTLRRDIGYLATVDFDTVILDEAQAIKNPGSQTAKASRLLVARHRLALTGTPIENHLGELGSLFEFLNPGLLGRLPILEVLSGGRTASKQELALVAEGIRPFILRRTKAQVLPDLPEKTEQVLLTTLLPEQKKVYDQLRAKYQASLLEQVESQGVKKSTMQVLEALLRLRQVACHPGLVDESFEEAGSAKLEALYSQVSEVLDEGHKLIIFSQFTKLLGYVQRHFDQQGTPYAYLDGQTRNRGDVVDRFQTDPTCNIFLVSLKAGGTGLNLTAAGYVFLLDPWWNPAVEAQAIDRAHRIGQTQPVFAYRMIAQDTVEEKILELQRSKRQIADAILEGEGQSLSDLTADDLKMLLS